MGMPMLVGAGVGALGSAVTGGNPFKGALLGGAGGALTGGMSSLLSGGSFIQGATGAMNPLSSALVSAPKEAAVVAGTSPSTYLTPYTQEIGMANTFNTGANIAGNAPAALTGATGEIAPNMGLINTVGTQAMPEFATTMAGQAPIFNPAGAGGMTTLTDAEYQSLAQAAQQDPSLWEKLKPYVTPQNMIGAASIASQFKPQPYQMPAAGGGGVKQASFQKPQGNLLDVQMIPSVQRPRFY